MVERRYFIVFLIELYNYETNTEVFLNARFKHDLKVKFRGGIKAKPRHFISILKNQCIIPNKLFLFPKCHNTSYC